LPSQWGAIETWNLKHGVPKMSLPVLFAAFKDPFLNPFFIFTPRKTWNILGSTNFWWFHPKIFPPSWHIGVLIPSDFF